MGDIDERDVFSDPRPGDVVEAEATGLQLHVHIVSDSRVYCGRWSKRGEPVRKEAGCDVNPGA